PLPAAVPISGTLDWVIGTVETNAGLNAFFQLHAYVLRGSDTLVGTLLTNYAEPSTSTNEWGTTATGKGPTGAVKATLSSVTAQAGDRIVIEGGYIAYSTRADTGRMSYGGATTTDLT